jgi:hypothetical protein
MMRADAGEGMLVAKDTGNVAIILHIETEDVTGTMGTDETFYMVCESEGWDSHAIARLPFWMGLREKQAPV